MNRKIPLIANILFNHGSFSKPFINWSLETDIQPSWKHYFLARKYSWKRDYQSSLKEIDKGLSKCGSDKTIYYLLLIDKLTLLRRSKDPKGDEVYIRLQKDIGKIPVAARKNFTSVLLNYFVLSYSKLDIKKIRIWSKEYEIDKSTQVFVNLGRAREEVKNGNLHKATAYYLKSFRLAEKIPHPTGILNSTNDLAWYLKNTHPLISLSISKKANYYLGWYFEELTSFLNVLDTYFVIQEQINEEKLVDTAKVILFLLNRHGSSFDTNQNEIIKELINKSQKLKLELENSIYDNSPTLRAYIKRLLKNSKVNTNKIISKVELNNIFRRKVKSIRGETIRKLLTDSDCKIELTNSTTPIISELWKLKLQNEFLEASKLLQEFSDSERIVKLIITYMSSFDRKKEFPYLVRKDKLKRVFQICRQDFPSFQKFMDKRWETRSFLVQMIKAQPVIEGRKSLAEKFLNSLPPLSRLKFIYSYLNLDETSQQMIDMFVRNYSRYDLEWGLRLNTPTELISFIEEYSLKRLPTTLAFYCLDKGVERKKLTTIFKTMESLFEKGIFRQEQLPI